MKIVYVAHALSSCWNNGNAHFQRGLLRELTRLGHDVLGLELRDGWSVHHLRAEAGEAPIEAFRAAFSELTVRNYGSADEVLAEAHDADLVIAHEWVEPRILAALSGAERRGASYALFFHDTHHRAVTNPASMAWRDLDAFDAVLVFGRSLVDVYERAGFGGRVFVLHEAADLRLFTRECTTADHARLGLVWVGNWGEGERSREISEFLLEPAHALKAPLDVYGVRYPEEGLRALERAGARYHGFLPHGDVPDVFRRYQATVHIPRRIYAETLVGIPTIRMFEAMAAGLPLVSAPWLDVERLFVAGEDYLLARSPEEMRRHLARIMADPALAASLSEHGRRRIEAHHTCRHRAAELMDIYARVTGRGITFSPLALNSEGAIA